MTDRINEKLGAWLLQPGNDRDTLAERIGITLPTLRERLTGRNQWKWSEVIKVAEITDCSLDELAGLTVGDSNV